ncbi:phage holin family protein [Bergeyella porcorum]|uniref:Phage holin family protein n=1 Tax=Bergeyella porcorum TaxID=1735111 RepID=A0AAU0F581_9FLAO
MIDILKQYAAKRADLLKMEATEKTSVSLGTAAFILLAVFVATFFIILLNIGLGLWIGYLLGNYAYGVLIMGGVYLLILIVLFLARKSITNSVANKIIKLLNP